MRAKASTDTIGMNLGGAVDLGGVTATMVEAKHSAAAADEKGTHYVGVATGFVLDVAGGPVLYHAGDTAVFGDMQLIRELYQPRVAMLPIGGYYTMGPKQAALACRLLAPEISSSHPLRHISAAQRHAGRAGGPGRARREGCALEAGRRISRRRAIRDSENGAKRPDESNRRQQVPAD